MSPRRLSLYSWEHNLIVLQGHVSNNDYEKKSHSGGGCSFCRYMNQAKNDFSGVTYVLCDHKFRVVYKFRMISVFPLQTDTREQVPGRDFRKDSLKKTTSNGKKCIQSGFAFSFPSMMKIDIKIISNDQIRLRI